jgi:methyl-accepting chemotaxis protein
VLSLKNKSIAAKIGIVIAGFSLLACSLIGLATYGLQANDSTVQQVLNKQARALFLAAIGQEKASRMHQRAFEVLAESDATRSPELQKGVAVLADDLAKTLADMKPILDEDDFKLFDTIKGDFDRYRTAELRSYDLQRAGKRTEAEDQLQGEVAQIFAALNGNFEALVSKQVHDMDEASAAVHDLSQKTVLTMIVTGLVGLVLTIAGALWLVGSQISRPIRSMTETMRRLAAGDTSITVPAMDRKDEIGAMAAAVQFFKTAALDKISIEGQAVEARRVADADRSQSETERASLARSQAEVVQGLATGLERLAGGDLVFRLQSRFASEYEKLRADFNTAMDKLQDTMKLVAASSSAIQSGSAEIATAADDLSRRTEQQAASLEETAAALDEITVTVRKTSEGASHARKVVSEAKTDAEHTGQVVGKAVQAMTAIEKSSRQVSQIIGVIDEIAFQTNLLALNAGVEAARAGEAGRGFAVVASEVRGLAQRSAEAAKEIKALISTSTEQVSDGVSLVGETGEALGRILDRVGEINTIVSGIASSAHEQAAGLDQVNTAVNQMDQVTQQNAAMVEQSTASSRSLADETRELARLIGHFQLGHESRERVPAKQPRAGVVALKTTGRGGAARKVVASAEEESWDEF